MNRRSFLTGLLGLPLLMLPKQAEAKVLDPVDVAIRDKRIVLGVGGSVERCDFVDSQIVMEGAGVVVQKCSFKWGGS